MNADTCSMDLVTSFSPATHDVDTKVDALLGECQGFLRVDREESNAANGVEHCGDQSSLLPVWKVVAARSSHEAETTNLRRRNQTLLS